MIYQLGVINQSINQFPSICRWKNEEWRTYSEKRDMDNIGNTERIHTYIMPRSCAIYLQLLPWNQPIKLFQKVNKRSRIEEHDKYTK